MILFSFKSSSTMNTMNDDWVVCPFNKSHIISKLRIQYHLVKCKKQYPFTKKLVCPYDATEYIDPMNYTTHLLQCKKKNRLDVSEEYREKHYESIQHGDSNVQTFFAPGVEVTDEWDIKSCDEDEDDDRILSQDELKVLKSKHERSRALQQAYKYSPFIPHSAGRGSGSDLYQNYIQQLRQNPENSAFTQSVSYFPSIIGKSSTVHNNDVSFDKMSEDEEGIYDDAENDVLMYSKCKLKNQTTVSCEASGNNICDNSSNKCVNKDLEMEEYGIYDDAEEIQINSETNKLELPKETAAYFSNNNNQKSIDFLNNYKSFMGRGSNTQNALVGRGTAVGKRQNFYSMRSQTSSTSKVRTLDHTTEAIQNKLSDNVPQLSKYNKEQFTQQFQTGEIASGYGATKFADFEEEISSVQCNKEQYIQPVQTSEPACGFDAARFSKFDEEALSIPLRPFSDNSSRTDKSTSYIFGDDVISFSKRQRKVNTPNRLDSLLNNIVSNLSLTSLKHNNSSRSTSSMPNSVKEAKDAASISNAPIVFSFGRGLSFTDSLK